MRRPAELLLDREGFLAWMVGLMVFLASLAIAAALAANGAAERWARGLAGTATVQVPAEAAGEVERLAAALRGFPGVRSVAALGAEETQALLEPWLGSGARLDELPLPRLIDLALERGADTEAIARRVGETVPGAVLDDHRNWADRLAGIATAVELAAVVVVLLVAAAAALMIVFATRAGLAAQRNVVELLHLVGARDGWIARQVERQALRLALRGGIGGLVLAALVIGAAIWLASGDELRLLPRLEIAGASWLSLLALPLVAGLVAMLTARIAVLRALRRLP
jgi:cell division transport system permease protein